MDKFEAYSFLFTDCFMGAFLLTPHNELVVDAMRIFGGYNNILILILAVLGNALGQIVNWLLGYILRTIKHTNVIIENAANYPLLQKFLEKHWGLPLLFSCVPFLGAVIVTAYGLFRINMFKTILFCIPLKFIFYYLKLFA